MNYYYYYYYYYVFVCVLISVADNTVKFRMFNSDTEVMGTLAVGQQMKVHNDA